MSLSRITDITSVFSAKPSVAEKDTVRKNSEVDHPQKETPTFKDNMKEIEHKPRDAQEKTKTGLAKEANASNEIKNENKKNREATDRESTDHLEKQTVLSSDQIAESIDDSLEPVLITALGVTALTQEPSDMLNQEVIATVDLISAEPIAPLLTQLTSDSDPDGLGMFSQSALGNRETEIPLMSETLSETSLLGENLTSSINPLSTTMPISTPIGVGNTISSEANNLSLIPSMELLNMVSKKATTDNAALLATTEAPIAETEMSTTITASPLSKHINLESQALPPLSPNSPLQQGKWSEAVTERVMWMSSKGIKEASVQLDPPELGSITIKISVNQAQAHVSFTVQNAHVREALDQNALRLREMFAEDGLNLVDVDVSDQSSSDQQQRQEMATLRTQATQNDDMADNSPSIAINMNHSLIDSYV
jgi:flagellar hook-length control protein FliK